MHYAISRRVIALVLAAAICVFCCFPVMQPPAQAVAIADDIIIAGVVALLAAWGVQLISSNASSADITAAVAAELDDYPNPITKDIDIFRNGVLKIGASIQQAAKWIADKFVSDGLAVDNSLEIQNTALSYSYLADGSNFIIDNGARTQPVKNTADVASKIIFASGVVWTVTSPSSWDIVITSSTGRMSRITASPWYTNYYLQFFSNVDSYGNHLVSAGTNQSISSTPFGNQVTVYSNTSQQNPTKPVNVTAFVQYMNNYVDEGHWSFSATTAGLAIPGFIDQTKDQYVSISVPNEVPFSNEDTAVDQIIGSVVASIPISTTITDNVADIDVPEVETATIEETQSLVGELLDWAMEYINPDDGLFSKFPFSVPYDIYLFFASVGGGGGQSAIGWTKGDFEAGVYSDLGGAVTYADGESDSGSGLYFTVGDSISAGGVDIDLATEVDLRPYATWISWLRTVLGGVFLVLFFSSFLHGSKS